MSLKNSIIPMNASGIKINKSLIINPETGLPDYIDGGKVFEGACLIGKSSGLRADFDVSYASSTTLTIGTIMDGSTISIIDIVKIKIVNSSGNTIQELPSAALTLSISGSTLTVVGFSQNFNSTDNFIIYTNIPRILAYDSGLDIQKSIIQSNIPRYETDPITIVTAQDLTDTNVNFGGSIDCNNVDTIGIYILTDVNNSENVTLDAYAQLTSGASELYVVDGVSTQTLWTTGASDGYLYYEYDVGAIRYLQLQAKAGTVGATAGDLTISIRKIGGR